MDDRLFKGERFSYVADEGFAPVFGCYLELGVGRHPAISFFQYPFKRVGFVRLLIQNAHLSPPIIHPDRGSLGFPQANLVTSNLPSLKTSVDNGHSPLQSGSSWTRSLTIIGNRGRKSFRL
jgi:hypothetical protein